MTTRSIRVAASADDCLVYWDGSAWQINTSYAGQRVGWYSATAAKCGGGMRFLNLSIPKNSTINTSYIILRSGGNYAVDTVNSYFTGELLDGGAFSTLADYQSRRGVVVGGGDDTKHTVAQVPFDAIAHWAVLTYYNSPSLNSILQEIVNANAAKNITLFWDDHDDRSSHSVDARRQAFPYDADPGTCSLLYVNFTPPYKVWPGIPQKMQALGLI